MTIGAIFVMVQTYFHLRFVYRTINDLRVTEPEDITELRNDIVLWQRAAESLSSSSKDEDLVREILLRKINRLQLELNRKITCGSISSATYKRTLEDLQAKVCEGSYSCLIILFIALFLLLVSDPESWFAHQVLISFDICHVLFLLPFVAIHRAIVAGLDRFAWSHSIAHFSG